MTKRINTLLIIAVAASAALASAGVATASATKARASVIPIVMKDPGCHWFSVNGKMLAKYSATGATVFRNGDEAPLLIRAKHFSKKVAVGETIVLTMRGVYHITMVGQHPDDNHLRFVLK